MSLKSLCADAGFSLEQAAIASDIDVELLRRCNSGRQALPVDVCEQIAEFISSDAETVKREVMNWTIDTSSRAKTPYPADPFQGDAISLEQFVNLVPPAI